MRFTKFDIKNFKGIKRAVLNLNRNGSGKIITLVGLNECGKTTILEAINAFSPDTTAENLYKNDIFRKLKLIDLVPKARKDNFTGKVSIEASLKLSYKDKSKIENYCLEYHDLMIDLEKLGDTIVVKKVFSYENSDFKGENSLWSINLFTKTKRAKIYRDTDSNSEEWLDIVKYIRKLIPSICYFPTFLFEFPTRVYLSHTPTKYEPQNDYYKQIIQDILDSLDRGLNIEEHIVGRVEKIEKGESWDFFKFWESDRKDQVEAVMNHLGSQITRSVFTRWNEIFGSQFTKQVKIEWNVDNNKSKPPIYLRFSIQDGTSTYAIAERSLGFRWFFCFLLFTQFRKSRPTNGTLFLFDEPASNLHATAQQQLLSSFESVTEGDNYLIYSTHSHYMINPNLLEGAFIVQNGAISYDEELGTDHYQIQETDIKVTPYRTFVGENPNKSTYYQPILDALDYKPGILEHQKNTVMVEGKGDFYAFTYFKEVIFSDKAEFRFLPSSGVNDLGPLIALYLGWSLDFILLLDDDKAGKKARKKYIDRFYLNESKVLTLGTVVSSFKNKELENLISPEGKNLIKESLELKRLTKKSITRFFQAKLARKEKFNFDKKTVSNFKTLLNELREIVNGN